MIHSYIQLLKKSNTINKQQWFNKDELNQLQNKLLTRLIQNAYKNTPFYSKIFTKINLIDKQGNVKLENFNKIPILKKSTIRDNFKELISNQINSNKWIYKTTGGSTGEPLKVIHDIERIQWKSATKKLHFNWCHYKYPQHKLLLWGSEHDLFKRKESFKKRALLWMLRETKLNAFKMDNHQMLEYIEIINKKKPKIIHAYANSLYEFANFIKRNNLKIYSPKSIITSAGTLFPFMRERINQIFTESSIYNSYGSRDVGKMAMECDHHKGLHTVSPLMYTEIIKPDGSHAKPGEVGEIIITLFHNYTMPLIRYSIGDIGSWTKNDCTCGRKWPLLENVFGRTTDVFVKKNGSIITPEYFIHLIGVVLNSNWILKYQVIQEDYDDIQVFIIPKNTTSNPYKQYKKELINVSEKIKLVMGKECKVNFIFTSNIEPSPSGKHRYTISKIQR